MTGKNYRLVPVNADLEIPVPRGLTPEPEAQHVARFPSEHSPEELEAEHRELKALRERDDLRDFGQVIAEITRELQGSGQGT
jgi:hypothetical protein